MYGDVIDDDDGDGDDTDLKILHSSFKVAFFWEKRGELRSKGRKVEKDKHMLYVVVAGYPAVVH